MAVEDLKEGMKQAMERGYKLEEAKKSFINSGYNPQEVEKAATFLKSSGETFSSSEKQNQQKKDIKIKKLPQINPESFNMPNSKENKKQVQNRQIKKPNQKRQKPQKIKKKPGGKKFLIIFLILFLLLIIAGIVTIIFFREQILEFLEGIEFLEDFFK